MVPVIENEAHCRGGMLVAWMGLAKGQINIILSCTRYDMIQLNPSNYTTPVFAYTYITPRATQPS